MTSDFTWVDTPNDPTHPLPAGSQEVLRFQADKAIDRIIVDLGSGDELCAYRDGAFRGSFAAKSSVDGSNNVALFRDGGWPRAPKVIPKVAPAPPAGGLAMAPIYEVDFTALATQTIGAPGPYTIDGLTWYLKGLLVATPGGLASGKLVNGSGLGLTSNFAIGYIGPGNSPNNYLRWFAPLAQIANFNPSAPVALQFVLSSLTSSLLVAGFSDCTNDAAGATAAQRPNTTLAGGGFPGALGFFRAFGGTADYSDDPGAAGGDFHAGGSSAGTALSDWQIGVIMAAPGIVYVTASPWTGAFTPVWSIPLSGEPTSVHVIAPGVSAPSNLGIAMVPKDQSGGSNRDYWMRRLRVSQPKVPL